ncbi:Htur_1727 family rSAM-partnered candidate RiPP [Natronosalvus rutilus]|uniref:Htur_1727 family rSAM-partnered candidate RiPP n=1 Tax=Natronosalvus rutilus TaxID=2953753 RepID=A0A9E7N8I0_9EURY|nr:Htur_1727 family rSAM-partnered candidate RiPP [Natronosalvus rutilus]UTF52343.1 Htur_1727 family rSAM-partnered candidate RiPP [Natronosalvus rutilus]
MVESIRRERVAGDRRGTPLPQWEVFLRENRDKRLHHVGSVSATSAEEAVENASRLFGRYAADLWVCPAEAVGRYSTRPLSTASCSPDEAPDREVSSKPRVSEESDGVPRVNDS